MRLVEDLRLITQRPEETMKKTLQEIINELQCELSGQESEYGFLYLLDDIDTTMGIEYLYAISDHLQCTVQLAWEKVEILLVHFLSKCYTVDHTTMGDDIQYIISDSTTIQ